MAMMRKWRMPEKADIRSLLFCVVGAGILIALGILLFDGDSSGRNPSPTRAAGAPAGADSHSPAANPRLPRDLPGVRWPLNSTRGAPHSGDPLEAAAEIAAIPDESERDEDLTALMREWASSRPDQAAAWVSTLPSGEFRADATRELAVAWSASSPRRAAAWARQEFVAGRTLAAAAVLSQWAATSPADAASWLQELGELPPPPGDPPAADLTAALIYSWSRTAPADAAAWVAKISEGEIRNSAIVNLAAGWASNDPQGLASWLDTHVPSGEDARIAAYVTLTHQWASTDPQAAGQWVGSLEQGEVRETMLAAYASTLAADDPAAALTWANRIDPEAQRRETIVDIYDTWLDNDLPQAKRALADALPAMESKALQHELYQALYDRDPEFRDELFNLLEGNPGGGGNGDNNSESSPPGEGD